MMTACEGCAMVWLLKREAAWAEEELPCGHAKHPPLAFGFGLHNDERPLWWEE